MHEDYRDSVGHLVDAGANGVAARSAPCDARAHLRAADLLRQKDRRLLPTRGSDDHDLLDPLARIQPFEALGKERTSA